MDLTWLSALIVGAALGFCIGARRSKPPPVEADVDGDTNKLIPKGPLEIEKLADILDDFKMVTLLHLGISFHLFFTMIETTRDSGSSRFSEVASSTILSVGLGPWKSSFTLKLIELIPAVILLLTSEPPILRRSPKAVTLSMRLSLIFDDPQTCKMEQIRAYSCPRHQEAGTVHTARS
ncbi:hypothetical protein F2Q69_00044709 [Brassica cretica]|uniref:Uncharacterized protein n=1 Tax=Brassica cretica TaxID=69181 RepID=A0A8S9NAU5_BRACR|nr:hypothetical protein F2Q69_00044709 [Brassica cretica]